MGTHHEGTAAEKRALDAYIKLMRAARSVTARLVRRLAAERLTERQFGVLETLYHLGPLPQCTLGRKQLTTGGNITFVVDNLVRGGLAERRRDSSDRRIVTVHLTPKGRALIAQTFPRHAAAIQEQFAALTPDEQEALARLAKKLGLAQGLADDEGAETRAAERA